MSSSKPVPSPEARWLKGSGGVEPLFREGTVTVWKVTATLASTCTAANAPLREVPDTHSR